MDNITLPDNVDEDNFQEFKDFLYEIEKCGTTSLKCGRCYDNGEYMLMPVRITTPLTQYNIEVPLEIDPLEESDEEILKTIVNWMEEEIKSNVD